MKKLANWLLLATASLGLIACGDKPQTTEVTAAATPQKTYQWKMVTSWPKNFPGLGVTPENFAKNVEAMSNGRIKIKVYGGGELVPPLEVFGSVSNGTAEVGHDAAYYAKGKLPAAQLFTAIPFGMNAQEMNGWLHYGGGMKLWEELYAPFNLIPMAGGSTGNQMAGWFKKEINSIDDLKGLKMRIPGLAGEVLKRVGGVPVTLSGGELFTALQSGTIDATEWVGPYNDMAFGLHKAAEYYYYSPWHEPGATLQFIFNKEAFEALPADLQAIVRVAARAANQDMLDEYTARNNASLNQLVNKHGVKLKKFPADVMAKLKSATAEVMAEQIANDPKMKKVWDSYQAFFEQARAYHDISEKEYYLTR
ncbi:MAG: TRAP-type mannitol/chloroaromatic compound transport system substrate-binding protein [Phenylobacterium sp.]|jgi:TRAP-type mannitol/chloroaromatic compound transport system substrate-binding protein